MTIQRGTMPPNFVIQEFVHPEIVRIVGLSGAIQFVSEFQVNYANLLRTKANVPIILNDWHTGGQFKNRGTRVCWDRPKGGGLISQHLYKNAIDASSRQLTTAQLFQCAMDNWADFWEIGLTTFEDIHITKTWLHGDGRLYDAPLLLRLEKEKRFNIVGPAR